MAKTRLIGEYKQGDGWHLARVFDTPAAAIEWRGRVDGAGGHEHARRTRRVKTTSDVYFRALEAETIVGA